jgi:hypothetical protein
MPTNDTWARDHGGITVLEDGKPVVYDFTFNGWGMKFAANHDNLITRNLYMSGVFGDAGHKNCFGFILEGGSIESDGLGTLLTTAECLLSDNRNHLSEDDIEAELKEYFGAKQVLWLNHGYLAGDDTFTSREVLIPEMIYPTSPVRSSFRGIISIFSTPTSSASYSLPVLKNFTLSPVRITPFTTLK